MHNQSENKLTNLILISRSCAWSWVCAGGGDHALRTHGYGQGSAKGNHDGSATRIWLSDWRRYGAQGGSSLQGPTLEVAGNGNAELCRLGPTCDHDSLLHIKIHRADFLVTLVPDGLRDLVE